MTEFFDDVVYSLKPLNYEIFNDFGLDLLKKKENINQPWSGVSSKLKGEQVIVTNIVSNSPGVESGLSVNDEIIAINGWRLKSKLEDYVTKFNNGERLSISYSRDGKMHSTKMRLLSNPEVKYELVVKDITNKQLVNWLD
jgi:predicted metalloprotease with PDZ domain